MGGGLLNQGVALVSRSAINGNAAGFGGGVANSGTLTLTQSTLDGNAADFGGAIANEGGLLTVIQSTLSNNTAHANEGGGLYNPGTATLSQSAIVGNTAGFGGGITTVGTLTLAESTLGGNAARSAGGGIANDGILAVTRSTLSGNAAGTAGGGLYNNGSVTLSTSTLVGNTAAYAAPGLGQGGGGIYNEHGGAVTVSYATVAANSDGLFNDTTAGLATLALTGTIVANSSRAPNCTGPLAEAAGDNLDSGAACGFSRATDLTQTNPLLGPLGANGGPTATMPLLPDSPAIDQGGTRATGCPLADQRGEPRPEEAADGGTCDRGAYETQGLGAAPMPPGNGGDLLSPTPR